MATAINDFDDRDSGPREKLSRALGAAGAIYGLLALITAGVAIAGVLGLAGLVADPAAVEPARMLGLPWTLAMGDSQTLASTPALLLTLGGLAVNFLILTVGAALARGRRRRV